MQLTASEVKHAILQKKWKGKTPPEWGFKDIPLSVLQRKNRNLNEYYFYTSDTEYTVNEAETIIAALEKNESEKPIKIFHANCRIDSIIPYSELEKVPQSAETADANTDTQNNGSEEQTDQNAEESSNAEQGAQEEGAQTDADS